MSTTPSQKPENGRSLRPAEGDDTAGFQSKLSAPRDRFLAAVVDHALGVGRRSAKDFLRHFPPRDIMNALADQPRLRAKLLVSTTGINEKVALRKPAGSAGEDLEIALSERVTEPEEVVALLDPDDRVRYLDHARLWAFLIEGEFWRTTTEGASLAIARAHIAFILARARAEMLILDSEIVDGIGLDVLVGSLPKADIVRVLDRAIRDGRGGRAFKDERVLEVLSPQLLVEHVSLAHLWERLIGDKLAFVRAKPAEQAASAPPPTVQPHETPTRTPPPPRASAAPVASRPPAQPSEAPTVEASMSEDLPPSLNLNIDEDEPIIIDEGREDELGVEVDAMLSRVGVPDDHGRPTEPDAANGIDAARTESGAPARPSTPPPQ